MMCSTNSFYQKHVNTAGDGKKLEPYRPSAPRNRPKYLVGPKRKTCVSAGELKEIGTFPRADGRTISMYSILTI